MKKSSYKVLVVDDDKFLLDIYAVKFKQEGMSVSTAVGGKEALEVLSKDSSFDAVLLDIVMPDMDGLELFKEIKEKKYASGSAIIILTNQGQQEDIDRAKEAGVDGYIIKASTLPSEVLSQVIGIIENKQP